MQTYNVYQFFVIFVDRTTMTVTVLASNIKPATTTLSEYLSTLGHGDYQITATHVKGVGVVAPVVEQSGGAR